MSTVVDIDVVGFPRGKLGIGEQGRSLARVAIAAGFNVNFIDCWHPSDNFQNNHREFEDIIKKNLTAPIRIYSGTQPHIGALIYRYGSKYLLGASNIFHLAWEFDERPKGLEPVLSFANELWTISEFTKSAYINENNLPVRVMPNTIEKLKVKKLTRKDFSINPNNFIFYQSFDMNSSIERKNPYAVIEAFKIAFPNEANVGLVIKINNGNYLSNDLEALCKWSMEDQRIKIVNLVLEKEEAFALQSLCDAYISLHRSEGFGFGIVEAMQMEMPVICTAYSGNMDFCSEDNAYLIDFNLVPVRQGEYPYSEGFKWADPSVKSAAKAMIEVYRGGKAVESKVKNAIAAANNLSVNNQAQKFKAYIGEFIERNKLR